jgi:2-iminobutanoate/2-iminopropanoate deaminase
MSPPSQRSFVQRFTLMMQILFVMLSFSRRMLMPKARAHQKIHSDHAPKAIGPYSQAIAAGEFVFVSGQLPIDLSSGKLIEGDIEAMTNQVIDHIAAILRSAGLTLGSVVKTEVYLKNLGDFAAMNSAYALRFAGANPPARLTMQAAKLPMDAPIEISCIAYRSFGEG